MNGSTALGPTFSRLCDAKSINAGFFKIGWQCRQTSNN